MLESTELIWDDKFEYLSIEELQYLNEIAMEVKHTYATFGSVGDDEDPVSEEEIRAELKEDFREMIFGKRRDGKPLKGIRRESDLKNRLLG